MESKTNNIDNSRRRSSLRNPIDMKKFTDNKNKSLHFLDSIKEDNENTNVSLFLFFNIKILIN
jgi:hypothetical protein